MTKAKSRDLKRSFMILCFLLFLSSKPHIRWVSNKCQSPGFTKYWLLALRPANLGDLWIQQLEVTILHPDVPDFGHRRPCLGSALRQATTLAIFSCETEHEPTHAGTAPRGPLVDRTCVWVSVANHREYRMGFLRQKMQVISR